MKHKEPTADDLIEAEAEEKNAVYCLNKFYVEVNGLHFSDRSMRVEFAISILKEANTPLKNIWSREPRLIRKAIKLMKKMDGIQINIINKTPIHWKVKYKGTITFLDETYDFDVLSIWGVQLS
jgi:hypothetical protein